MFFRVHAIFQVKHFVVIISMLSLHHNMHLFFVSWFFIEQCEPQTANFCSCNFNICNAWAKARKWFLINLIFGYYCSQVHHAIYYHGNKSFEENKRKRAAPERKYNFQKIRWKWVTWCTCDFIWCARVLKKWYFEWVVSWKQAMTCLRISIW